MAGQTQPASFTSLTKQGAFDNDIESAINSTLSNLVSTVGANATDAVSKSAGGSQSIASALAIAGAVALNGGYTAAPTAPTQYSGATDAIAFPNAINIAQITSTSEAATLATPGSADAGKLLLIINSAADANTVTTASGKILDSSSTAKDTLTATAHAGSVALLVAINGFWVIVALSGFAATAV